MDFDEYDLDEEQSEAFLHGRLETQFHSNGIP